MSGNHYLFINIRYLINFSYFQNYDSFRLSLYVLCLSSTSHAHKIIKTTLLSPAAKSYLWKHSSLPYVYVMWGITSHLKDLCAINLIPYPLFFFRITSFPVCSTTSFQDSTYQHLKPQVCHLKINSLFGPHLCLALNLILLLFISYLHWLEVLSVLYNSIFSPVACSTLQFGFYPDHLI